MKPAQSGAGRLWRERPSTSPPARQARFSQKAIASGDQNLLNTVASETFSAVIKDLRDGRTFHFDRQHSGELLTDQRNAVWIANKAITGGD